MADPLEEPEQHVARDADAGPDVLPLMQAGSTCSPGDEPDTARQRAAAILDAVLTLIARIVDDNLE